MMRNFVKCSSCGKIEKLYDHEDVHVLTDFGWVNRSFDQLHWSPGYWFCSEVCAFDSEFAIKEEEKNSERKNLIYQRGFEKFCKDNEPNKLLSLLSMVFVIVMFFAFCTKF